MYEYFEGDFMVLGRGESSLPTILFPVSGYSVDTLLWVVMILARCLRLSSRLDLGKDTETRGRRRGRPVEKQAPDWPELPGSV